METKGQSTDNSNSVSELIAETIKEQSIPLILKRSFIDTYAKKRVPVPVTTLEPFITLTVPVLYCI